MAKQDRKVILVASSDRWQAGDYGLKDDCMLVVGKHNLADELKKMGGAQGIMCASLLSLSPSRARARWRVTDASLSLSSAGVDMPTEQFEQLLDGCRFHSSLVLLSPRQDQAMTMPIGASLSLSFSASASRASRRAAG